MFALKKPSSGVRPIAVGNTLRRLAAKCAGKDHELLEQRKCSYGSTQLGFGTKNGCEAAVHATGKFLSSPGISEINFENAFNSISRQQMLENISEKYLRLKNFAFSAYSQPSYLFFGSHILNSDEGAQQGDSEGPPIFCDTINDMIHSLTSALNFWYLDDGNLADKFRVVFEDLKLVIERARMLGLKVKPSKCELTFLGSPSEELKLEILQLFNTICTAIQETPLDDLCILGAGMGADCVLDKLTKRSKDLELLSERLVEIEAHSALFLLKNSFSIPKLTFLLRTSPCFMHPDILSNYDSILTWKKITNVQLQILLASKPVCLLKWVAWVCHLRHCLRLPYFYPPRALALLCQTKSPLVPDQQATKKLLWNSGVILHKHFHQLIDAPKRIGLGQYSRT